MVHRNGMPVVSTSHYTSVVDNDHQTQGGRGGENQHQHHHQHHVMNGGRHSSCRLNNHNNGITINNGGNNNNNNISKSIVSCPSWLFRILLVSMPALIFIFLVEYRSEVYNGLVENPPINKGHRSPDTSGSTGISDDENTANKSIATATSTARGIIVSSLSKGQAPLSTTKTIKKPSPTTTTITKSKAQNSLKAPTKPQTTAKTTKDLVSPPTKPSSTPRTKPTTTTTTTTGLTRPQATKPAKQEKIETTTTTTSTTLRKKLEMTPNTMTSKPQQPMKSANSLSTKIATRTTETATKPTVSQSISDEKSHEIHSKTTNTATKAAAKQVLITREAKVMKTSNDSLASLMTKKQEKPSLSTKSSTTTTTTTPSNKEQTTTTLRKPIPQSKPTDDDDKEEKTTLRKSAIPSLADDSATHDNTTSATTTGSSDDNTTTTTTTGASNEDVSTADGMLQNFQAARNAMMEQLRSDYGNYFEEMFMTKVKNQEKTEEQIVSIGRTAFLSAGSGKVDGKSRERMKRKMMIKLLPHLLMGPSTNDSNNNNNGNGGTNYIWATGGHSSAAGHGNMYAESYTAVMERIVRPVFSAVGMNFVGRNYAMGGTSAGPEIAFCEEEIFGNDIDVLSWDYGMTDGRDDALIDLYCRRAAYNPGRPACVGYHVQGSGAKPKIERLRQLDLAGMTTLYADADVVSGIVDGVPDTIGLDDAQIEALPESLRYMRCGIKIENGDPFCKPNKFNDTICADRKYKAKWHPGWKYHAVQGVTLALFLVELLDDAIQELVKSATKTQPATLMESLKAKEDDDYNRFFNSTIISESSKTGLFKNANQRPKEDEIDLDLLYNSPNYCHTGRMPAEIRHKGILTETTRHLGMFDYYKGMRKDNADRTPNDRKSMRLVYDLRFSCPEPTAMDYKDYFYINSSEGWKSLTVPNDSEIREYGRGQTPVGLIVVCMVKCEWDRCDKGDLRGPDLGGGFFDLEVNGVPVTHFQHIHRACDLIRHKGGYYFDPNDEGRFEFSARVNADNSYLRFSSFIVW